MAKGDKVTVVYQRGADGEVNTIDWTVAKAGRVLEVTTDRKEATLHVEEQTPSGTITKQIDIRLDRVISVEQSTPRA